MTGQLPLAVLPEDVEDEDETLEDVDDVVEGVCWELCAALYAASMQLPYALVHDLSQDIRWV